MKRRENESHTKREPTPMNWAMVWLKRNFSLNTALLLIPLLGGLGLLIGVFVVWNLARHEHAHALPETLPRWSWKHDFFGRFDPDALQRGYQIYEQVCASCHGMTHLAYRDLEGLGYSAEEVKLIAARHETQDGPDDQGEFFTRPARPSDRFVSPFPNDEAARAANSGALPPDLSLIVKIAADEGGADHIFALLTGYEEAPEGVTLEDTQYYNPYYEGNKIAMPPPLIEGSVSYADGTQATLPQMAADITSFLAWAAEPKFEVRRALGHRVMLYLALFCGILFVIKHRLWKRVHNPSP